MNELIKPLQRALEVTADGIRGPVTTAEILKAADEGRLTAIPRVPAPVSGDWHEPPSRGPAAPDEPPWITAMKVAFGWHEVRDKAKLQAWLKSDGKTLGDPTALPWCGDAVETAMRNAGFALDPRVAANPYWARNWLFFGRPIVPCIGAVLVFERGPSSGHVGFAIGHDADEYFVLGGNQSDSVSIARIAKTRLLGSRWPIGFAEPTRPLPRMDAGSIPKSTNEF